MAAVTSSMCMSVWHRSIGASRLPAEAQFGSATDAIATITMAATRRVKASAFVGEAILSAGQRPRGVSTSIGIEAVNRILDVFDLYR